MPFVTHHPCKKLSCAGTLACFVGDTFFLVPPTPVLALPISLFFFSLL